MLGVRDKEWLMLGWYSSFYMDGSICDSGSLE